MDTKIGEDGTIIVSIDKDKTMVDEDSVQDYIDVLNGIVLQCSEGGYKEGYRNEIIVNMVVSAYMLGLDAMQVLDLFKANELIKDEDDDEWPQVRVQRVADYQGSFSWGWMIDPSWWVDRGHDITVLANKVKFELA